MSRRQELNILHGGGSDQHLIEELRLGIGGGAIPLAP